MLRFRVIVPVVLLIALVSAAATHAEIRLRADMTNAEEPGTVVPTLVNGDSRPVSFGRAFFVINDAMTAMTMEAKVFNIDFGGQTADTNDDLSAAHIHASATEPPPATRPVVWGFIGTPFNDTTPTDTVVTPFPGGVGAMITSKWDAPEGNSGTTLAAQLPNILNERSYINFHTRQFPGGEVRGTLFIVPEPASLLLFGVGPFALAMRRRIRSA